MTRTKRRVAILDAALVMDWDQPILNRAAPCFHLDNRDKRFCGRGEKWAGHPGLHKFVRLNDVMQELIDP